MNNSVRSLAARLYSFAFFDAFILIYPIYTLFMADSGLTPFQISSLLIVWSATTFLLELPSGALADKLSRKQILLIGIAAKIIGYTVWLLVHTYLGFLIGFVLWGVKSAFAVGAQDALVYEELKRVKAEKIYAKFNGRMSALKSLGYVLSGFGASLLARHGYTPILALSIGSMIVSGVALAALPETPKTKEEKAGTYRSYVREATRLIFFQPRILYMMLFMSLVFGLGVIDEYFSLFFREKGLSNTWVAFWVGAVFLSGGVANLLAHRLQGRKIPAVPSLLGWAAVFWLATVWPSPFAPLLICLYMFYFSGLVILIQSYLQRELTDKTRATALSVTGVFIEAISLLMYLLIGLGVRNGHYRVALQLVGSIAAGAAVVFWAVFRNSFITHTPHVSSKDFA